MDFCVSCYSKPVLADGFLCRMLWRACFLPDLSGHCGECLGRVLPGSVVQSGYGVRVSASQKGGGQRAGVYEQRAGRLDTGLGETRENDGRESVGSREGWPL